MAVDLQVPPRASPAPALTQTWSLRQVERVIAWSPWQKATLLLTQKEPALFSPVHSGRGSGLGEQIECRPCSMQNSPSFEQSNVDAFGIGVLPTVSHMCRTFPSQWLVSGTQLASPQPPKVSSSAGPEIRTICATIMSPTERKTRRRSFYTRALSRTSFALAARAFAVSKTTAPP